MMAAGSSSTITLDPQKQRHFVRRLTRSSPRVSSFRLDTMDGARGSANGGGKVIPSERDRAVYASPGHRNHFVLSRTKNVDKEPLHSESQHSFLPCSPRNLFQPRLQAACRLSLNPQRWRSASLVPCAI